MCNEEILRVQVLCDGVTLQQVPGAPHHLAGHDGPQHRSAERSQEDQGDDPGKRRDVSEVCNNDWPRPSVGTESNTRNSSPDT